MSRNTGFYWFVAALGLILVLGLSTPTTNPSNSDLGRNNGAILSAIPHNPIFIIGDTNFTLTASLEGWDGTGSSEEPFIIENLQIDTPSPAHCIYMANTSSHFRIQNCVLGNSGANGIRLSNVTNGVISNVTVQNCNHGIVLRDESFSNTVTNCVLQNNNGYGLYIRINSHNNNFMNVISYKILQAFLCKIRCLTCCF